MVLTSTIKFDNYFLLKIDNFDLKSENNEINMHKIPIGKTQVEAVKIIDSFSFWLSSENEKNPEPMDSRYRRPWSECGTYENVRQ